MASYLIDFENVHYEGLSGILNLSPDDKVYIFYSDNGKRLTFELHEQINKSQAQFFYYKAVVGGKNALDHQLSSYLGYLICEDKNQKYHIVSKDQGYRHLIAFWKTMEKDIDISLIHSIKLNSAKKAEIDDNIRDIDMENAVAEETENSSDTPSETVVQAVAKKDRSRRVRSGKKLTSEPKEKDAAEAVDNNAAVAVKAEKAEKTDRVDNEQKVPKSSRPKIIEFVLPAEVLAAGKKKRQPAPGRDNTADAENILIPPIEMPDIIEPAGAVKKDSNKDNEETVKSSGKRRNRSGIKAKPRGRDKEKTGDKDGAGSADLAVGSIQEAKDNTTSEQVKDGSVSAKAPEKKASRRRSRAKKSEQQDAAINKETIVSDAPSSKERKSIDEATVLSVIPDAGDKDWLADITKYINTAKGKSDLYNMIRRRLGQNQGRNVYNMIKKLI